MSQTRLNRRVLVVGSVCAFSVSATGALAMDECETIDPGSFDPVGPMVWFGQTLYWVGARACADAAEYALLKSTAHSAAQPVWTLAQPAFCNIEEDNRYLLLTATGGTEQIGELSQGGETLLSIPDPQAHLSSCRKRHGDLARKLQADTGRRVYAVQPDPEQSLILQRGEEQISHLALLRDNGLIPVADIKDPLAWHNPQLHSTADGGFLAYPLLDFDERRDLAKDLPGIPVYLVSADGSFRQTHIPWADWNMQGAYKIAMTAEGLVMAVSLYRKTPDILPGALHAQSQDWAVIGGAGMDAGSLTVRSDGTALAWRSILPDTSPARRTLNILEL